LGPAYRQKTKEEGEMSGFPGKVLLATDGSEDATLAARAAISLSGDTGAELHVVHVGPGHVYPPRAAGPALPMGTDEEIREQARGVLDWQVEEIEQAGGEVAKAHLRVGKPDEEILRLSEEIVAGLIVIGNQGLGGRSSRMRRFLMGSVSERVARYARLFGDGDTQGPLRAALSLIRVRSGGGRASWTHIPAGRMPPSPELCTQMHEAVIPAPSAGFG
jgi:nucleotide-binding universal stress UspA family protein